MAKYMWNNDHFCVFDETSLCAFIHPLIHSASMWVLDWVLNGNEITKVRLSMWCWIGHCSIYDTQTEKHVTSVLFKVVYKTRLSILHQCKWSCTHQIEWILLEYENALNYWYVQRKASEFYHLFGKYRDSIVTKPISGYKSFTFTGNFIFCMGILFFCVSKFHGEYP